MRLADRRDAGRRLAALLAHLRGQPVVVLGLPRGGVPVAFEVARALDAPLDVIMVRKLGVPFQPELGMGAIGEDGVRILNQDVIERGGISARIGGQFVRRASRSRLPPAPLTSPLSWPPAAAWWSGRKGHWIPRPGCGPFTSAPSRPPLPPAPRSSQRASGAAGNSSARAAGSRTGPRCTSPSAI